MAREGKNIPISVILDRFLNASDASDARSSLKQLCSRAKLGNNVKSAETRSEEILEMAVNPDVQNAFCHLIARSTLVRPSSSELNVDEGGELACELIQAMIESTTGASNNVITSNTISRQALEHKVSRHLLTMSNDRSLVSSLLDLLCNPSSSSGTTYPRILSMQLLSRLYTLQPNLTQNAIIATPEGLNRLVDLFSETQDEVIRNEVLVLLNTLSSQSTTIQKLLLFAEGMDRALAIATLPESKGGCGGLLGNNGSVILDCLNLIQYLMSSENGMDMFLTTAAADSWGNITRALMDGRQTRELVYKDYLKENSELRSRDNNVTLDDLLRDDDDSHQNLQNSSNLVKGPTFTETENQIIKSMLRLILQCISSDDEDDDEQTDSTNDPKKEARRVAITTRRLAVASQSQLMSCILPIALYRPPASITDFAAGAPREDSQCMALEVLATLLTKPLKRDIQENNKVAQLYNQIQSRLVSPLLLYSPDTTSNAHFIPNKGGVIRLLPELFLLSSMGHHSMPILSAIVTVIREVITEDEASMMVLHALAPPPSEGEAPSPLSPVLGLSHHINSCLTNYGAAIHKKDVSNASLIHRAIAGSCASLGVVLQCGSITCREMLLNLSLSVNSKPPLPENGNTQTFLKLLITWLVSNNSSSAPTDEGVRVALLQLLCEWCYNCPSAAQTLIGAPDCITLLDPLLRVSEPSPFMSKSLLAILLGELMEYMGDKEVHGWSRSHIMQMIQSRLGLSKFTEILQSGMQLKNGDVKFKPGIWMYNQRANKDWLSRYSSLVQTIRRRLVQEVTGTGSPLNKSNSANGMEKSNDSIMNPLAQVVEEQAKELEEVRKSLSETRLQLAQTRSECKQWKYRCLASSTDADALAEQIELSLEAQRKATELQQELDRMNLKIDEVIQLKDDQISALEKEGDSYKLELSNVQDDLKALSQAYTSLEDEYRLVSSRNVPTSDRSIQQAKGEDSASIVASTLAETDSSETHVLKLELQQLKEQVAKADEWMNMAQESMAYMDLENKSLKKQLKDSSISLNGHGSRPESSSTVDDMQLEISSLKRRLAEMPDSKAINDQEKFVEMETTIRELESANKEAQDWMKNAVKQQEDLILQIKKLSHENQMIEIKYHELKTAHGATETLRLLLAEAQAKAKRLESDLNALKSTSSTADQDLIDARAKILEMQKSVEEKSRLSAQLEKLRVETKELQQQLERATSTLSKEQQSKVEELQAILDAKNLEMLAMKDELVEISPMKDEISDLRKANESAQEWMANAVEFQQSQSVALEQLTSEKQELLKKFDTLKTEHGNEVIRLSEEIRSLSKKNDDLVMCYEEEKIHLSSELAASKNERDEVEAHFLNQLSTLKEKLAKQEESLSQIRMEREMTQIELKRVYDDKQELEKHIQLSDERVVELEKKLSDLELEKSGEHKISMDLREESAKAKSIQDELNRTRKELAELASEKIELQSKLTEFSQWSDAAQKKIDELERTKASLQEQVKNSSESETKATERFNLLKAEYNLLDNEMKNLTSDFSELKVNYDAALQNIESRELIWQERCNLQTEEINSGKRALEKVLHKKMVLEEDQKAKLDILQARCTHLESTCIAMQSENQNIKAHADTLELRLKSEIDRLTEIQKEKQACMIERDELLRNLDIMKNKAAAKEDALTKDLVASTDQVKIIQGELDQLKEEMLRLANAHEVECTNLQDCLEDLQHELHEKNIAIANAEEAIECYTKELTDQAEHSSEIVNQWKARCDVLEGTVHDLENALQGKINEMHTIESNSSEQLEAANEAISLWEARCAELTAAVEKLHEEYGDSHIADLEVTIEVLNQELLKIKAAEIDLKNELSLANNRLSAAESLADELRQRLEEESTHKKEEINKATELRREVDRLRHELSSTLAENNLHKTQLTHILQKLEEAKLLNEDDKLAKRKLEEELCEEKRLGIMRNDEIHQLKEKCALSESAMSSLQKELWDSQVIISQLQNELRDAYESIQSRVTDDIANEATGKAAQILRFKADDLRKKLEMVQEELRISREECFASVRAFEQLKSDIAFLVHAGEYKGSSVDEKLQDLVVQVSDERILKERKLMDDLNKTIQEMRNELTVAKINLKEAEQSAASARIAKNLAEKETAAAKKENKNLQESIARSRSEDYTAIGALRGRLEAIEEERDLLVKSQQEQVALLRADISKLVSEKDNLVQSMHEFEVTNNSLLHAHSINGTDGKDTDNTDELHRLRIEKAQLLASVAQSSAKVEQRVRSLLSAQLSKNETEVIVERELRQAAESELSEKKNELRELKSLLESKESEIKKERTTKLGNVPDDKDKEILNKKLQCISAQHEELRQQNSRLRAQLEDLTATKNKITEQCQALEIELRRIQREKRFDENVSAEVVRLRYNSSSICKNANGMVSPQSASVNFSQPEHELFHHELSVEEMWDVVMELKESMKEERSLYRELLTEHEDLLALLAQQDLERSGLRSALASLGGESAVEDAMREAEEYAVDRFGEFVHLS